MADSGNGAETEEVFQVQGQEAFKNIIFEKNQSGIGRITLNRPDSLNSLSAELTTELIKVLGLIEKDNQVRAVILSGAGRGFCAGADLKNNGPTGGDPADWIREYYNPLIMKMNRLQKPIIAAVNGVAAGAGFSLALACDIRVASEKARFISAFIRIGLVPDSGLAYFLPRLVGLGRALEITTTGDEVPAAKALEYGLVNRVVPANKLEEEALSLAVKLALGPTYAIGLTKSLLGDSLEKNLPEVLEMEAQAQHQAAKSQDFREGVAAFVEKRAARFTGY